MHYHFNKMDFYVKKNNKNKFVCLFNVGNVHDRVFFVVEDVIINIY